MAITNSSCNLNMGRQEQKLCSISIRGNKFYGQKAFNLQTSIFNRQMSDILKERKRNNARVNKWREMLAKGLFSDPALLLKRARKGIPPSIRSQVWPQLINLKKVAELKSMSYSKVLIKDSYDVYDINLDIPRTFSFQSQEVLRQSLFNVLKALSIEFPKIGYCQGMNFLAMRLLQVLDDDSVFYMLTYLFNRYKSIYQNFLNPGYVTRQNAVFQQLLEEYLPKAQKTLTQQNLDPVMYTPSWFLTLFSKSLQQDKFYRFMDCFLVEGYCFIYKMALALIQLKEKQIVKNSMEQNFTFVPNMQFYHAIDADKIIESACKFPVTNHQVQHLQTAYTNSHKKQIERMQKASRQGYEKKLHSPRRVFEWTMQDFKKTKVHLLTFESEEQNDS